MALYFSNYCTLPTCWKTFFTLTWQLSKWVAQRYVLIDTHLSAKVDLFPMKISNQIVHYTRCITPKRITSLRAHLRVIAPGQNSSFRKNVAAVATLCSIWPAWDLNLRTPAPGANTSPLDRLDSEENLDVWNIGSGIWLQQGRFRNVSSRQ